MGSVEAEKKTDTERASEREHLFHRLKLFKLNVSSIIVNGRKIKLIRHRSIERQVRKWLKRQRDKYDLDGLVDW